MIVWRIDSCDGADLIAEAWKFITRDVIRKYLPGTDIEADRWLLWWLVEAALQYQILCDPLLQNRITVIKIIIKFVSYIQCTHIDSYKRQLQWHSPP